MARQYYKDSTTGQMKPIGVKVEDTLPVGFEGEIADGTPIPEGWVEVEEDWVTCELNTGFTGTLKVKKVGKVVNVVGVDISGNFVGGTAFSSIPEGYRPPNQINYAGRNTPNDNIILINQNSAGAIRTIVNISNAILQFSFTYLID